MDEILKLTNVSKHYSKFDLKSISLSLPAGCIMGFIGENGAGKSTTIKCILGLIHKDSGTIEVFGQDSEQLSIEMREQIGVVMDALHLPEEMTASNVAAVLRQVYKTWHGDIFNGYIKRFKIDPKKRIKEYSRGMKMKLAIAMALSHDTKLLILDEPTSGLDPVAREQILDILLEFIQDEDHGIFISSHILTDLEKICDYITLIHDGKIVLGEEKDLLMEQYSILKCSKEQLKNIAPEAIVAKRVGSFGVEALVYRNQVQKDLVLDQATLEDIMVFYAGEVRE